MDSETRLEVLLHRYEEAQRRQRVFVPWIRTEELKHLLEQSDVPGKVVLIDVREEAEQRVSILRDALLPTQLEQVLDRPLAPDTSSTPDSKMPLLPGRSLLVPYCTAGVRSATYGVHLATKYPEWAPYIRNGEGIVRATYVMPDHIIERDTGEVVRRVHVYAEPWNLAAPGFEAVQFSRWECLMKQAGRRVARWLP
jgi:rhodanese-related sulfurtransferase